MRLPNRKPGKYTFATFDPNVSPAKLDALKEKLKRLKTVSQPQAIKATQLAGENGDFSENAEYQIAKGKLRGINQAITELEYQINHAVIIETNPDTSTVQLGHTVTLEFNQATITYTILGSTEANPTAGIISNQSPLGKLLIGKKVGDIVQLNKHTYKLVSIT